MCFKSDNCVKTSASIELKLHSKLLSLPFSLIVSYYIIIFTRFVELYKPETGEHFLLPVNKTFPFYLLRSSLFHWKVGKLLISPVTSLQLTLT
jgi:hypothetical protein